MLDDRSDHADTLMARKILPSLYSQVDEKQIHEDASNCLANYGTKFEPALITAAKGLYIHTASGHAVLDWTSGQMSCLVGHGHPEVVQVIASHAASLDHTFSGFYTPPVVSLAKRLTSALPRGLDRAFFLSTGGESNEAAIRLAKTYTGKFEIVGLGHSWHGCTAQAQGIQFKAGRQGHGRICTTVVLSWY